MRTIYPWHFFYEATKAIRGARQRGRGVTRGKVEGGGKAMRGGVTRRVTTKGKTMRRETTNDDEATRQ